MGKKASFLPKGAMDKYLVCNADESEPGTFKDRELMQKNPHMLIEGMIIAAYAVGADARVHLHPRRVRAAGRHPRRGASRRRATPATSASDILGSDHSLTLVVHRGAGAYICGEETALLDSLEGKRGNPRLKPPFPANQGLYQGPTLINNVETLATVPHIIEMGGEEYAKLGVENSTGTKLVSVSGNVQRPGNYEIELGHAVARDHLRPRRRPARGPRGQVLVPRRLELAGADRRTTSTSPYDFDSMAKAGSMLGSGAIIVVDDSNSVVDVALKTAKFYRHESCGKCTPCREGTNWTVKMLERIEAGEATPMDLDIMASVQEQIIGNCLCVLGDAMAMPIGSMIAKFRDEFEAYIEAARARNDALTATRRRPSALVQGAAGLADAPPRAAR